MHSRVPPHGWTLQNHTIRHMQTHILSPCQTRTLVSRLQNQDLTNRCVVMTLKRWRQYNSLMLVIVRGIWNASI